MLGFTSDKRNILGIDYDPDKIELANNCISKSDRIRFVAADANTFPMEPADVFILSDMLHYIPDEKQEHLVVKCIERLKPGGMIIIRDADKDMHKRHAGTRFTEFFSTRLGFNKAEKNQLYFFSGRKILEMADRKNMKVEIIDNTRLTSNLVYILRNI
jgi:2-polyprenyl-3-methyl-5-hydroxy-6-metoxy-1,4-benzoquinol methylase